MKEWKSFLNEIKTSKKSKKMNESNILQLTMIFDYDGDRDTTLHLIKSSYDNIAQYIYGTEDYEEDDVDEYSILFDIPKSFRKEFYKTIDNIKDEYGDSYIGEIIE